MNTLSDPVHFSNLKHFAESAAHYKDSVGKDEDKLTYRIGRLTHLLLLGVQPGVKWDVYEGRRAGKEWEAFRAARPGVDIFTASELALCKGMAASVAAHPLAVPLLKGEFEVPVEWTDAGTGRRCATRGIDVLNRAEKYTAELKTAASSEPGKFTRAALQMGYHAQGSWMQDAARSLGVETTKHFVIAVEKRSPHVVTVFCVTGRAMLEGAKACRSWLEQLKTCEDSNEWPGYVQYIADLDVPSAEDDGLIFEDEDGDADETSGEAA